MKRKRMKRLRGIEIEVQNVEIVKKRRGEIKENERERDEAYDQVQRRKNELFVENRNQKILIHKKEGKIITQNGGMTEIKSGVFQQIILMLKSII